MYSLCRFFRDVSLCFKALVVFAVGVDGLVLGGRTILQGFIVQFFRRNSMFGWSSFSRFSDFYMADWVIEQKIVDM